MGVGVRAPAGCIVLDMLRRGGRRRHTPQRLYETFGVWVGAQLWRS